MIEAKLWILERPPLLTERCESNLCGTAFLSSHPGISLLAFTPSADLRIGPAD